ncbi:MAG: hypothetical protein BGO41_04865 [Clostridiales bacterium 38-18]|nr:MAG: hypothetical protein BGO41_04865 [Clostridiales bacterium 38-18]
MSMKKIPEKISQVCEILNSDNEIGIEHRLEKVKHNQKIKVIERYSDELKIVTKHYADIISKKVSFDVIKKLKVTKAPLMTGDDSVLENVWEEICVQMQFEESFFWDTYEFHIIELIKRELESLPKQELQAIWLSTDEFQEIFNNNYWDDDLYGEVEDDEAAYIINIDSICEFVLYNYVLSVAVNENNEKIDTYLNGQ